MSTFDSLLTHVTEVFRQAFPNILIEHDSDFFELGGDSLAVVAMCTALEGKLGIKVHPSLLFYHPTVEEMAEELTRRLQEGTEKR